MPEKLSDEELLEVMMAASAAGEAKRAEEKASQGSGFKQFRAGTKVGVDNVMLGAGNMAGMVSDPRMAQHKKENPPQGLLSPHGAGQFVGEMVALSPLEALGGSVRGLNFLRRKKHKENIKTSSRALRKSTKAKQDKLEARYAADEALDDWMMANNIPRNAGPEMNRYFDEVTEAAERKATELGASADEAASLAQSAKEAAKLAARRKSISLKQVQNPKSPGPARVAEGAAAGAVLADPGERLEGAALGGTLGAANEARGALTSAGGKALSGTAGAARKVMPMGSKSYHATGNVKNAAEMYGDAVAKSGTLIPQDQSELVRQMTAALRRTAVGQGGKIPGEDQP